MTVTIKLYIKYNHHIILYSICFTLYLDPRNIIMIKIMPSPFLLIIIHCICALIMNTIIILASFFLLKTVSISLYSVALIDERKISLPANQTKNQYIQLIIIINIIIIVVGVTPSLKFLHTTIKYYYMLIGVVSIIVFVQHRYIIISILKSISIFIFIIRM